MLESLAKLSDTLGPTKERMGKGVATWTGIYITSTLITGGFKIMRRCFPRKLAISLELQICVNPLRGVFRGLSNV